MLDLLPKGYCNLNGDIIYFFISYDLIVNMKTIFFVSFGNVVEIYNVISLNMGFSLILNIIYISCATINDSSWN
jgi:hypothetical protein